MNVLLSLFHIAGLTSYALVFGAGAYFGRRRLHPRASSGLLKLLEGAVAGFIAGKLTERKSNASRGL